MGGTYGGRCSETGDGGRDSEEKSKSSLSSMEGAEGVKCELDSSGALAKAALRESNALSSVATCPEREDRWTSSVSFGWDELEDDTGCFEELGAEQSECVYGGE